MKHVVHTYTQTNTAPPNGVFPLLCPVREAEWVPGWKHRLIHSQTGYAELGCVFATPNEQGPESIWVITDFQPDQRIAFTWVWPGMIATRLTISLAPADGARTHTTISYEYTALSEAGERELASYNESWFASKMKHWEAAINHFLQTGTLIDAGAWK